MPPRTTKKTNKYKRVRRKVCNFCVEKVEDVDYKNTTRLRKFISDRGKILPRRTTGTCATHQRILAHSIKRAREIALLITYLRRHHVRAGVFAPLTHGAARRH
jgi:small subunit ribosomal protein S18